MRLGEKWIWSVREDESDMWRALFLALGVYACLLGAECLVIDKAVLAGTRTGMFAAKREVIPSEWAPWSLLSAGAVTILYSFSIPKRLVKT